ncbi:MAG: hypothetical protein R3B07_35770 [Polyangiaceae bacterium]
MAHITNLRRYLLLKARKAFGERRLGSAYAWNSRRRALLGTPLPADIPNREWLLGKGYEVLEELEGTDAPELTALGLRPTEANAVLAFLTPPAPDPT